MEIYVASAFSKNNTGGNKAGVVVRDYHLTDKQKIKIARQLGYSETAFISASRNADFQFEYFTPVEEVPMCGHATIAAFVVLKHLGMLSKPEYKIETKSGILTINIDDDVILMQQNLPSYFDIISSSEIAKCIDNSILQNDYPIQIVSTGLKDILVPINHIENLQNLNPDFEEMINISRDKNVVGIHAFTLINQEHVTAICRNFAPLYGINEESATGTSNCTLACYLFKYGIKKDTYLFEQGYELHNPSRIIVHIQSENNTISNVAVGGNGYLVETLSIDLDSKNAH